MTRLQLLVIQYIKNQTLIWSQKAEYKNLCRPKQTIRQEYRTSLESSTCFSFEDCAGVLRYRQGHFGAPFTSGHATRGSHVTMCAPMSAVT